MIFAPFFLDINSIWDGMPAWVSFISPLLLSRSSYNSFLVGSFQPSPSFEITFSSIEYSLPAEVLLGAPNSMFDHFTESPMSTAVGVMGVFALFWAGAEIAIVPINMASTQSLFKIFILNRFNL